jgi:hypothetical protein
MDISMTFIAGRPSNDNRTQNLISENDDMGATFLSRCIEKPFFVPNPN